MLITEWPIRSILVIQNIEKITTDVLKDSYQTDRNFQTFAGNF